MEDTRASRSGRTSPARSAATGERTSAPSSNPSPKSQTAPFLFLDLRAGAGLLPVRSWQTGIASPGAPSTRNTGECPSAAAVSTLSQILQADAPAKYSLSARACEGILRRAKKRGEGDAADAGGSAARDDTAGRFADVVPETFHTLTAKNCGNAESAQTPNCVCYTQKKFGVFEPAVGTLTSDPRASKTSGNIVCMATAQANSEIESDLSPTLLHGHERPIVFRKTTRPHNAQEAQKYERASVANCLNTFDVGEMIANELVIERDRRYTVRRLTPLECCRLQGFPDWWERGVQGSDSARYRMWGNGIALPCARYALEGVADALRAERRENDDPIRRP